MNNQTAETRQRPQPQQIYRHFKGNTYQIMCIAVDSEDGSECVVYQALYGDYRYYVRPLDMFMSEVDHVKYPDVTQKYRFELISAQGMQAVALAPASSAAAPVQPVAVPAAVSEENESADLDPDVEAFLDADTYEQRVEILGRMHYKINDDMIDIMSTVVDMEIPAGRISDRYERFKDALMMRRNYEAGRLR